MVILELALKLVRQQTNLVVFRYDMLSLLNWRDWRKTVTGGLHSRELLTVEALVMCWFHSHESLRGGKELD
jgi:hypothetical protein